MTTDVKGEPVETKTEPTTEQSGNIEVNPNQQLLDSVKAMFESTVKELKDSFEKKTEELNTKISEKDAEIEKLKQANANMALTSNFGKDNNGNPDYKSMDFDEVDWVPQVKSYLDNIDTKIFDLKVKQN